MTKGISGHSCSMFWCFSKDPPQLGQWQMLHLLICIFSEHIILYHSLIMESLYRSQQGKGFELSALQRNNQDDNHSKTAKWSFITYSTKPQNLKNTPKVQADFQGMKRNNWLQSEFLITTLSSTTPKTHIWPFVCLGMLRWDPKPVMYS